MKKITFILLALISGTAFAQNGATGEAIVHAEIVSPLTISESGGTLSFGSIASDKSAGNVRIDLEGTRTFSNPNMVVPSSNIPPSAASFTINAANGFSYRISIPNIDLELEGGTEKMALAFTSNADALGTGTGEDQELLVGGLLSVGVDQTAGSYKGTAVVTVAYE